MTLQQFFGALSIIMLLPQFALYAKDIYQNKTKPHLFSWIIWTLTAAIIFFAQWFEGAGSGAWVSGGLAVACFFITLAALKASDKTFTKQDFIFLSLAIAAIPVWYITNDPLWAVLLVIFIEICAFYLTIKKKYIITLIAKH